MEQGTWTHDARHLREGHRVLHLGHLLAVPHHVQHRVRLQVGEHHLAVRLQAHRVHKVVQQIEVDDQHQIVHVL